MFYSLTNPRPAKSAPNGSRYKPVKQKRFDERGNSYIAIVGQEDQYAAIQSFKESTDINNIVRRATLSGTLDQLAIGGVYADGTKLPQTLAESYAVLQNAEAVYNSLSEDQLKNYPDFITFLNSFGNVDGVADFINTISPKAENIVSEEVSE